MKSRCNLGVSLFPLLIFDKINKLCSKSNYFPPHDQTYILVSNLKRHDFLEEIQIQQRWYCYFWITQNSTSWTARNCHTTAREKINPNRIVIKRNSRRSWGSLHIFMKIKDQGSYHWRKYFDTNIDWLKIENTQICA